ncbi:Peptide transporter PTR2 [Fusarium albosuccineum]|uniref:Peptide transporter PTR2 n=1 Tax=Fusarium albosuccineum TaxID=1237068 RepID=A0A8H4L0G1_9HYPO|nr:Peptide transporter PTR2 [Fusarium albosuccineum]
MAPPAQAQESDTLSLSSGPHHPIDDNPKTASINYDAKPLPTENVDPDHPAPTEEERQKLRKVAGYIPWASYLLCIVELAERASFYGVKTVFNNYIQFPLPKGGNGTGAVAKDDPNGHAGALNKGLQFASAMVLLFQFLAYIIPIFGAWLGDTKTGRFRAIMYGVIIGGVAHVILVGGAAPSVLKAGNGLAPFMISFFLLAIGAGLFKPNVVPLIVDQYTHQKEYVKTLKSGERVLVDPETTVQRIMLLFYMCINVGAFFMIATTYIEKYAGFWLAFLVPGVVYILLPALLMWRYKTLIRTPPQGSDLNNFIKIVGIAIKENKGKLWGKNYFAPAKPAALAAKGTQVSWTNKAVDDARRTLSACQIFLYLPIFFLGNGGVGSTGSNQGASMTTKGAPNDLLHNFNPLTLMVVAPLMTYVLYPFLHRRRIKFGAISRMTFGYTLATIGGISGTIVQYRVYKTSPCGYYASTCDGVSPISIWWQLPNVMLGAMGELFCTVTAYELAYARSPPGMKSIVVSISLAMQALSAALAQILIPAIKDPHLIWAWAAPAIALFVQTVIFWFRHHHINEEEFMTYEDEENASESEKSQRRADAV